MQMRIPDLRQLVEQVFLFSGVSEQVTTVVVDHLMDAELSGKASHGIIRIPNIITVFRQSSHKEVALVKDSPVSALLDGGGQLGIFVATQAMSLAISKARSSGIAFVGASNTGWIGVAGIYARMALESNLIGIVTANSEATVAPYGSSRPLLGTNPLAIGIPAEKSHILVDISTSIITFGDVLLALKKGEKIPSGSLLSKYGHFSTDPNDLEEGALLPIANHKGSALGLALEILAGPLVAAKAGFNAVNSSWGFLMGVINPEIFVPIDKFMQDVQALIDEVKMLEPGRQYGEVLIPGERSSKIRQLNQERGIIEVPDFIITEIRSLLKPIS